MRILLLLNGPRERYVGGADTARQIKWREYCSRATAERCGKRRCCKGVCLWNQRCVDPRTVVSGSLCPGRTGWI